MWKPFLRNKHTLNFIIPVCVEKDGNEFYAYCPALKGIHVDGATEEEAIENVKIASSLYIESLIRHGDPIPIQISQQIKEQIPTKTTHSNSKKNFQCYNQQPAHILVHV